MAHQLKSVKWLILQTCHEHHSNIPHQIGSSMILQPSSCLDLNF
ncbi:hypothetical protein Hdeb2414_s0016g00486991 [Helianthus debilis subsp. tardiflorus]